MRSFVAVSALAVLVALTVASRARAQDLDQIQAAQTGQTVHDQLEARGEILPRTTRLYGALDPIARRIAAVANPQLDVPLAFVLVHEPAPNAFAVPGGNVYVTDSLFRFVRNADELAAVLCHETSHEIHHDARATDEQNERAATIVNVVGAITRLDRTVVGAAGQNLAYRMQTSGFSREVERRADFKGAMTCAAAGYNPWGMVWLFRSFAKADSGGELEPLADHPTDAQRISDLEDEFSSYPQIFSRFSPDSATAAPL
jgi:predicted Zn-dependent protease